MNFNLDRRRMTLRVTWEEYGEKKHQDIKHERCELNMILRALKGHMRQENTYRGSQWPVFINLRALDKPLYTPWNLYTFRDTVSFEFVEEVK